MKRPLRPAPLLLPVALTLLSLVACSRCGSRQPAGPPRVSADEAELATLAVAGVPPGSEVDEATQAVVNEWGTGGAFVVRDGTSSRLVHGRTVSQAYQGIDQVALSPDGRRVAFVAQAGEKVRLVVDGQAGEEADALDNLGFTPDGRHVLYRARAGERWWLGVDRLRTEPRAAVGDVRLGPDGATVTAVERWSADGPWSVAAYDLDLRRKVLVEQIAGASVLLGPGGRKAAAVVESEAGTRVVIYDLAAGGARSEGEPFDVVPAVDFDATGSHVMYPAFANGELVLVLDGKASPLPAPNMVERPVFNPVRGTVGVVLVTDHAFFHLVNGPAGLPPRQYEGLNDITFSPDGARVAYVAEQAGRYKVVVDGVEGPEFDRAVTPVFSPDSKTLAYRARQDGKRFVVLAEPDGTIRRRLGDHEQVFPVTFTPDGTAVAYAAKDGPSLRWKVEKL